MRIQKDFNGVFNKGSTSEPAYMQEYRYINYTVDFLRQIRITIRNDREE